MCIRDRPVTIHQIIVWFVFVSYEEYILKILYWNNLPSIKHTVIVISGINSLIPAFDDKTFPCLPNKAPDNIPININAKLSAIGYVILSTGTTCGKGSNK